MLRVMLVGTALSALVAACVQTMPATSPAPVATRSTSPPPLDPNVSFIRDMLVHHRQALAMTALVPSRASRADVRLIAERIDVSQNDEIATLRRFLTKRGHDTSSAVAHAHHGGDSASMPGMISDQEMRRLAAARGAEFDRLFLEYMIKHHEGALTMVKALFATTGAAQDPELFAIASEIEADQRAEIARMRGMLLLR